MSSNNNTDRQAWLAKYSGWLKKKKVLELKNKDGKQLVSYQFKSKKPVSKDDIKQTVYAIQEGLEQEPRFQSGEVKGRALVTTLYDESIGFASGQMVPFGKEPVLYDINNVYQAAIGEDGEKVDLQTTFSWFSVTVEEHKATGGAPPGGDPNNDCLWAALAKAYGFNYLPKCIKQPSALKRLCGVKRRAPVPVDALDGGLEAKLKANIWVEGDCVRESTGGHPRVLRLELRGGHYTLKSAKRSKQLIRGYTPKGEKRLCTYLRPNGTSNKKHLYYDGESIKELGPEMVTQAFRKPMKCPITLRQCESNTTLEGYYQLITKHARQLKRASNGLIDLSRHRTDKKAALYLLYQLTKTLPDPGVISQAEGRWIDYALRGGLQVVDLRGTEGGALSKAWSYDMNKMYSYVLQQSRSSWPYAEGECAVVEQLNDEHQGVSYGLYRAVVTNPGGLEDKLFHYAKNNHYTHYDLNVARGIGLSVAMVLDGEPNALLYPQKRRVSGILLFRPYVEFLLGLHAQGVPRCKKILNCLWGGLAERNTKLIDTTTWGKPVDYEGCDLTHIQPQGGGFILEVTSYEQRFVTDYARVAPFVTGYARHMMYQQLKPVQQSIFRMHTDGFISDLPPGTMGEHLGLNGDLGGWKVEKQGSVKITSLNKVAWSD